MKVKQQEERWSTYETKFLSLIGELYYEVIKDPIDLNAVAKAVSNNSSVIQLYANHMLDGKAKDYLGELIKGLSKHEKILIEAAKPLLEQLGQYCIDTLKMQNAIGNNNIIRPKNALNVFKNNALKIDISKAAKQMNEAVEKVEHIFVEYMRNATNDAFDQIGGYGIPDIFNLEGSDEVDKEALSYEQDALRYNKDFGQGKFLQIMMNDYYSDSRPEDRRLMLSFIIKDFKKNYKGTDKKRGGDYFASSLKGAGPLMQKMMQGVPDNMVVPELRPAINIVKSGLSPIDSDHVTSVIDSIVKNSNGKIDSIKKGESLGAASIAEVFSCEVVNDKKEKQEAVIKILRPEAEEKKDREVPIIRKYSMFADMSDKEIEAYKAKNKGYDIPNHVTKATEAGFLAQLFEIDKEFNFSNEAKNIKMGLKKYGGQDAEVDTVRLVDAPVGENYLLMTRAEGTTLDRIVKKTRDIASKTLRPFKVKIGKDSTTLMLTMDNIDDVMTAHEVLNNRMLGMLAVGQLVSKVAKVWTTQALYGASWSLEDYNFRHGDLHSGNIMIGEKATILDYGNASMILYDKVTLILMMMSAVVINNTEYFLEPFSKLLNKAIKEDEKTKNPIGYKQMTPDIREKYKKKLEIIFNAGSRKNAGIKILLALTTAQTLGIILPMELQNFSQCQQRLENSMTEVKQSAFELRKSLDKILRMPVDSSIKNSCDPIVMFHGYMTDKNEDGSFCYKKPENLIKALMGEFSMKNVIGSYDDLNSVMGKVAQNMDVSNDFEMHKIKYYNHYKMLLKSKIGKEQVTLKTFPNKVKEWREIFKANKENYERSGGDPKSYDVRMAEIDGFIHSAINETKILCEYEDDKIVTELSNKALKPPYDPLAFERLMAICEADLGSIAIYHDFVDKIYGAKSLSEEEEKNMDQLSEATFDVLKVSNLREKESVKFFLKRARLLDPKVFKVEMKRMFENNPLLEKEYESFNSARIKYNNLTVKNTREEFVEARRAIAQHENKMLLQYYMDCSKTFEKIYDCVKNEFSKKELEDGLKEYYQIIGELMVEKRGATLRRLGKKYSSELLKLEAEQDKKTEEEEKAKNGAKQEAPKQEDTKKEEPKKTETKKAETKKVAKKKGK